MCSGADFEWSDLPFQKEWHSKAMTFKGQHQLSQQLSFKTTLTDHAKLARGVAQHVHAAGFGHHVKGRDQHGDSMFFGDQVAVALQNTTAGTVV
jgi:hypothetical protein